MGGGTYIHHGGILFTTLDKLIIGNVRILVLVHASEYLFHSLGSKINACLAWKGETDLFRRFFVLGKLQHLASHLINGLNYL
jgi:hypothetical protein